MWYVKVYACIAVCSKELLLASTNITVHLGYNTIQRTCNALFIVPVYLDLDIFLILKYLLKEEKTAILSEAFRSLAYYFH